MRSVDGGDNFRRHSLAWFRVKNHHQFFANHGALWPKIIRGEDAEFLYRQALENIFDVLGIDIFAFVGDDHVFLAAEELQDGRSDRAPEIAGHQPAVDDGFRGQFGIVEIMRHDRLAANGDFADAIRHRDSRYYFHARQRLANGVRAEWFEIVHGDRRACFREP